MQCFPNSADNPEAPLHANKVRENPAPQRHQKCFISPACTESSLGRMMTDAMEKHFLISSKLLNPVFQADN